MNSPVINVDNIKESSSIIRLIGMFLISMYSQFVIYLALCIFWVSMESEFLNNDFFNTNSIWIVIRQIIYIVFAVVTTGFVNFILAQVVSKNKIKYLVFSSLSSLLWVVLYLFLLSQLIVIIASGNDYDLASSYTYLAAYSIPLIFVILLSSILGYLVGFHFLKNDKLVFVKNKRPFGVSFIHYLYITPVLIVWFFEIPTLVIKSIINNWLSANTAMNLLSFIPLAIFIGGFQSFMAGIKVLNKEKEYNSKFKDFLVVFGGIIGYPVVLIVLQGLLVFYINKV